jgi:hypothetical protein
MFLKLSQGLLLTKHLISITKRTLLVWHTRVFQTSQAYKEVISCVFPLLVVGGICTCVMRGSKGVNLMFSFAKSKRAFGTKVL